MKKSLFALLLAFLLLLPLFAVGEEANLLENGGFEEVDSQGNPKGWTPTAYRSQIGYGSQSVTEERSHSGERSVMIENLGNNDARYVYTAKVKPSSLYKLSAWVWVEEVSGDNGANLALEDIISVSDKIVEPTEGWQYLEWYGETGPEQSSLCFGVRLGGYGRESTGRVYFDDVVLTEVEAIPAGVVADLWYDTAEETVYAEEEEDTSPSLMQSVAWILAGAVVFLLLTLFFSKREGVALPQSHVLFAVFLLVGLLIRVFLAVNCEGYQVDINCFTAWSTRAASVGLKNFYAEGYFCDYPPAAILLLLPSGLLLNQCGTGGGLALLIVKLLPILTDIAGAVLLYLWACRVKKLGTGMLLSLLYLLNPAVLVTGAAWGQMDSVLALLILIAVYEAVRDRWEVVIPVYVFSVLVKFQALLVGPVALLWLVLRLIREKEKRRLLLRRCLIGLGIALVTVALVLLPFLIGKDKPLSWLFKLYGDTLSSYEYATINAANLYELLGANWSALSGKASQIGELVLALAGIAGAVLLLRNGKKRHEKQLSQRKFGKPECLAAVLLAVAVFLLIGAIAGVSYAVMGYGLLAFVYLFVLVCVFFDTKLENLPFYLALVICGIFTLSVKIHERYLFIALPLFLLAYLLTSDRRMLFLCVGFSITSYINTTVILNNSIQYGSSYGHLLDTTFLLNKLLAAANLGLIGWGGCIACGEIRFTPFKQKVEKAPAAGEKPIPKAESPRMRLRLADYLIMLATALVYGVLCFTNLGSTVAPQTAYVSSSGEETVVLKLDEPAEFSVLYYCGVSYHDFSIAVSDDGVTWRDETPCEMAEGQCYRWKYAIAFTEGNGEIAYESASAQNVLWYSGQYLRITACNPGLNLWEIVARDRNGENLRWTVFSHEGSASQLIAEQYPAAHLCDETDTCVGEPSWYNGTYFDEIYYARTAYEFLHGQSPYETSHPPLGKILMSACVAIFGMTPFGWRFAGAFVGVLMLPVMYLLAYQLLHKRSAAIASMGAMAFGLMHFTQTRLATIDTFPVFFIMLSYLFMIRFLQSDFYTLDGKAYRKSILSLGLCGACMGLSIASKWIGLYSAVGLAILYFAFLIRRWFASRPEGEASPLAAEGRCLDRSFVSRRALLTCCWCVLFFILVPALIYYLCYIPYFAYSGGVTLTKVINAQISMFNYHSTKGLGMDHPFYSPWWQWPLLMKPMWYAQDTFEPTEVQSSILCFGNQWVVYLGDLAMLALLVYVIIRLVRSSDRHALAEELRIPWILLIGFAVQFVPWLLVPRGTYIYHYFASIPFLILATAWWLDRIPHKKIRYGAIAVYLLIALLFFAFYFPFASGLQTDSAALDRIRSAYALMKEIPGFSSYFNLWY